MRRFFIISLLLAAMVPLNACANNPTMVKVSPGPVYNPSGPIPITVGVSVDETPAVQSNGRSNISHPYGPMIVDELKKMGVFRGIVYPCGKVASADALLHLAIKGKWGYYNGERQPYDFYSGASTRHYAEGTDNVKVIMTAGGNRIIDNSISVESKGEYSGSNVASIARRLDEIQTRKIAVSVADLLQGKRALIVAKVFNKPAEGVSTQSSGSAGAGAPGRPGVSSGTGVVAKGEYKTAEKLRELEDLHASGALSDEEFGKAKKRLLDMQKLDDLYKSGILTGQEVRKAKARMLEK